MTPRLWLRAWRDLQALRGRAIAAALILALGVALATGVFGSSRVLQASIDQTWTRLNLADLTVTYAPAPMHEVPDLNDHPVVRSFRNELIVPGHVVLDNGSELPAVILGTRYRTAGAAPNLLDITRGEAPGPDTPAVVVERSLSRYHGVDPGSRLEVIIGDRRARLEVTGVATSPEYLVASANPRFLVPVKGSLAVVFMPLATLQEIVGVPAVNRTVIRFAIVPDDDELVALGRLYAPLGIEDFTPADAGFGRQFLRRHINSFTSFLPPMVAVFAVVSLVALVVTLNRLVVLQRPQIGTLRAMGYGRIAVAASFAATGFGIGVLGSLAGTVLAVGLAQLVAIRYADAVGLPELIWVFTPELSLAGFAAGVLVATLAAIIPAWRAASIYPRDALAGLPPQAPFPRGIGRLADRLTSGAPTAVRLGMRNLSRRPVSVGTTVLGIGLALGLAAAWLMLIRSMNESVYQFFANDLWVYQVELRQGLPTERVREMLARAGASGDPIVQQFATLRAGPATELVSVIGIDPASPAIARDFIAELPGGRAERDALVLSDFAARRLGLKIGDTATLALGGRSQRVRVTGIVRSLIGDRAFVALDIAQDLAGRGDVVTGAVLPEVPVDVLRRLERDPAVGAVLRKGAAVEGFRSFQDQMLGVVWIAVAMSAGTAAAVLWSSLAVSLLEREAEFATLRARGFGSTELTGVILVEVAVQAALGMALAFPIALSIVFPLTDQLADALQTSLLPYVDVQDLVVGLLPAFVLAPLVVVWGVRHLMGLNIGLTVKRSIPV